MIKGGPGTIGDMHSPKSGGKKWGELPPHQRDRILQAMTEGFPAHYQQVLEKYYKRLAEEKPASETDSAGKPDAKARPAATDSLPRAKSAE